MKERHPVVAWRAIEGFPLIAAHSRADVWEIVDGELGDLRAAVDAELNATTPT